MPIKQGVIREAHSAFQPMVVMQIWGSTANWLSLKASGDDIAMAPVIRILMIIKSKHLTVSLAQLINIMVG